MRSMTFTAKLENLRKIINFILKEAKLNDFKKYELNKIRIICEEIVLNIIKYAYPGRTGNIEVVYNIKDSSIHLEFIDEGPKFNPLNYQMSNIEVNIKNKVHGKMGICLLRGIADKINYERVGKKNVLKVGIEKKRL